MKALVTFAIWLAIATPAFCQSISAPKDQEEKEQEQQLRTALEQIRKPSVLLPDREAYKITRRCSRGGPSKVDGTWLPTKVDLDRLESHLLRISKLSSTGAMPVVNGFHIQHPNQFYRQYIAIVIEGHKFIYMNAFCVLADEPLYIDWREMLVDACDGGGCYWGVLYDPRTGTFSDLQINAPG